MPRGRALKVATYNVNGVNGRLPRLLEWLGETSPDIVCPAALAERREIKSPEKGGMLHARERDGIAASSLDAVVAMGELPAPATSLRLHEGQQPIGGLLCRSYFERAVARA